MRELPVRLRRGESGPGGLRGASERVKLRDRDSPEARQRKIQGDKDFPRGASEKRAEVELRRACTGGPPQGGEASRRAPIVNFAHLIPLERRPSRPEPGSRPGPGPSGKIAAAGQ